MNPATTQNPQRRSAMLSYFSLFTSLGTLLCCALPSLLVLFGLGASVASLLAFTPWLVALSRHKAWTFSISGALIGLSFVNLYYFVPRLKVGDVCDIDDGSACRDASRVSKVLLWVSAGVYAVGFFVAYALGPILTKLDR
jgi:mercuric ion transport protein